MKLREISLKIVALRSKDTELRNLLLASGSLDDRYHPKMEQLHNENAEVLAKIIEEIGYPTIEKVGEDASRAAWLVIQHAIGKPVFLRKCLLLMQEEHIQPTQIAYLSDRIAFFEGREQLHGTQYDWDEQGLLSPHPYDDLELVNQRRAELNLDSLQERTKKVRQQAREENHNAPTNFRKRKIEFDIWRKRVGWIA